jgi:hypothetical protein
MTCQPIESGRNWCWMRPVLAVVSVFQDVGVSTCNVLRVPLGCLTAGGLWLASEGHSRAAATQARDHLVVAQ